jgi:hypothetical protein
MLYLPFQGIPYAGGHHCTENIEGEGFLAVGPDMAKVLAVVALHKVSLRSV